MSKSTKTITSIVMALVLMSTMMISCISADMLKGTPEIDGVMDDIYLQSEEIVCGPAFYSTNGEMETDVSATARVVYDDKNVYVFVKVISDNLVFADDSYILSDANPWENTCVEISLDYQMLEESSKISMDPLNKRIFGYGDLFDETTITGKGIVEGDGYTVEMAIPVSGLAEGNQMGFALQVNKRFEDGHVVASGGSIQPYMLEGV